MNNILNESANVFLFSPLFRSSNKVKAYLKFRTVKKLERYKNFSDLLIMFDGGETNHYDSVLW